jgi:ABC-type Fe3+ transport system permease subunit
VEILSQVRNTAFGTAAAYSVLLILLVLVITVGARWLEGRDTDYVRVADAGANVVRG